MKIWEDLSNIPEPQKFIAILWLSFLVAACATGIFFIFVDPAALAPCFDVTEIKHTKIYTIVFFIFWLLCASSSLFSTYFLSSNPEKR